MRRVLVAGLVMFPFAAFAQDCDGAQTTLEMGTCLQAAYEAADADLNRSYGLAMEGLASGAYDDGKSVADALKSAQRAWIAYRDLACAAEAALYEGGSMAGIARTACLMRLTQERITGLSEFLSN